jgi:hypothetical protein
MAIEGIGEAVTGGLLARAAEPQAGESAHPAEGNCLNCGAALVGDFCHRCGQKGHVHRTLAAFWHDLMHSVFHFEGKIWRTLPLLAWRPGELTRRYVEGERANFVSPVALFLFTVFLMFAVFSLLGSPFDLSSPDSTPAQQRAEAEREFQRERAETAAELNELRAERAQLARSGQLTASVDARIRNAEMELRLEERLFRQALTLIDSEERRDAALAASETARENAREEGNVQGDRISTEVDWVDKALRKAQENPQLLAYKLQNNAYKFSWALIPISVPFVWLLFLHRRRYRRYKAYDHTVFVTYSIAFMSLGWIVLSLLRPLGFGETLTAFAIAFIPPLHMYRQLRGAYRLSRWSAVWRTLVLVIFAFMAGGLFFGLLVTLGAFG